MHQPTRTRRGFSLIELLVTIAVIAIVIAILVPTLSGARNTARAAGSQAQLTEIGQASSQYFSDNQRLPGYFTPRQMGSSENEGRGFSGMQNIMLDLAGGIVEGPAEGNVIEVGPDGDNTVFVDLTFIGTTEAGGGYYTPRDTSFVAQNDPDSGIQETDDEQIRRLPSVVDSFNTPILAWQRDRTAIQPIEELADFVQEESGGDVPARFYWTSNAGFLKSNDLGKRGKNPQLVSESTEHSFLAQDLDDEDLINHLAVLLGSPSVPNPGDNADALQAPSAARGDLILHSAGIDAMYMSSKDIGGGGDLRFWQSFFVDPPTGSSDERIQDGSGQIESIDLLDRFDDLIETVGN